MSLPISAPASDPSIQISLRVDNTSELPKLLEGRTVAVLGQPLENLTAEAHEYRQKINLHEQLVRARRLRAIIEDAANRADALPDDSPSSYSKAMDILQSAIPHINELVKLTEALRGHYTLGDASDYDEWNEWTRVMDKRDEEQLMRDQRILRQQLREFGKETNKDLQLDAEIEQKHDELIPKTTEFVHVSDEIVLSNDEEMEIMHSSELRKKKNASRYNEDVCPLDMKQQTPTECESTKINHSERRGDRMSADKTDHTMLAYSAPENGRIGLIKKIPTQKTKSMTNNTMGSISSSSKQTPSPIKKSKDLPSISEKKGEKKRLTDEGEDFSQKKKVKREETLRKSPPETAFLPPSSETQTRKPPQSKTAHSSSRPIKKCHDCKESTARYRKCSYYQVTGNKCGKTFCIECLSSKYSLGDDVLGKDNPNGIPIEEIIQRATYDVEWHCPSCLKTCLCNVCCKQRERDDQRERSRDQGGRRSGRRTAEQSDYSNFFHMSGGMISFS